MREGGKHCCGPARPLDRRTDAWHVRGSLSFLDLVYERTGRRIGSERGSCTRPVREPHRVVAVTARHAIAAIDGRRRALNDAVPRA